MGFTTGGQHVGIAVNQAPRYGRRKRWNHGLQALLVACCVAGALVPNGHAQAQRATAPASGLYYLALGDDFAFGSQPGTGATPGAQGYAVQLRDMLARTRP